MTNSTHLALPDNDLFNFSTQAGPTLITSSKSPIEPLMEPPPTPISGDFLGKAIVRILRLRRRRRRS